jgi:hypothetical protein
MNIRFKFLNKYLLKASTLFITMLLLAIILSCNNVDGLNTKKEKKQKTDLFFLFLLQSRSKGNCLRKDTSSSTAYCDRRSSGICNANDLILTSGEKAYNLSEGSDLIKAVPSCNFSFLNSGIASDTVSSFSDQDFIQGNNSYSVVNFCEDLGITFSGSLINESELLFITSPRGRIAVAADKIANTLDSILTLTLPPGTSATQVKSEASACLTGGFLQAEKDLVSDLRTLKKIKAITCTLKSGSANSCPF